MGRTVPSAGRALFFSGAIAFVVLLWLALVLGATFEIGPLASLARNATPETRAKILRYSIYGIIFTFVTVVIWVLAGRYFIRSVPDNFAARIEVGKDRHLVTVAKQVWIMPFFEKLDWIDLRPRDLNFVHPAVTHDQIAIKMHVRLTWQPYAEDLQMVLDANIQQEMVLKSLVQRQLTLDVNKMRLEEIQSGLSQVAFHVMRHVAYPDPFLEGARKYGIFLQEVLILKLDLPKELVELSKQKKLSEMRKKYGPTPPGTSAG